MSDKINKYIGVNIKKALINARGLAMINEGSGDCDEIIIMTETEHILFKHTTPGKYGITAELVNHIHPDFNIEVDLSSGNYHFTKILYNEDGNPDTIVFKSENDYLHIISSDHELIITKSILDLSADIYFEDIPDEDPCILLL